MGLLQNLWKKRKENKQEEEEYERTAMVQENFEAKKLSANERELLRIREEERQKAIKIHLDAFRRKENDNIWRGHKSNPLAVDNITKGENLFKEGRNMTLQKVDLFDDGRLFKHKSMFLK